ncbi:uncharacterized protein LOC133529970 isoform X1 [Cydia pomonella]|uniref:uncharacterized protein LOC133529970 isoform X1 n=1 Tax=Cydia pomonella TaxID=82600 RepID=UPI002ADDA0E5|nr:uncharacterized protein LOC133529970 isoform X1 [Cydia pomonella]
MYAYIDTASNRNQDFNTMFQSSQLSYSEIDKKYYLVSEAHNLSKMIFNRGRNSYNELKQKSLETIDTFLDLVKIMNDIMGRELRGAIVKFYKIKYFHDFTNYMISMEEIVNITEHCLIEPLEKLTDLRDQFHDVIKNFEDVRNFDSVNKCNDQLPDEVATAHCILHQAVLFNEVMQQSLGTIVTVKTRQHAQDMNESIYNVQTCLNNFVPKFFEQLLVDVYTDECEYLKVVNASITDLMKDKANVTHFPSKWKPLTDLLKTKLKSPSHVLNQPIFATIFAIVNNTSYDATRRLLH